MPAFSKGNRQKKTTTTQNHKVCYVLSLIERNKIACAQNTFVSCE